MVDITRKEEKNIVMDITERETVKNNSTERAAVMYGITKQYRMCNRNEKIMERL